MTIPEKEPMGGSLQPKTNDNADALPPFSSSPTEINQFNTTMRWLGRRRRKNRTVLLRNRIR